MQMTARITRCRSGSGRLPAFPALFPVLLAACLALLAPAVPAAPGDLDGSFGMAGVVRTDVEPTLFRDLATKVFLRADGRILAAGSCDNPGGMVCIAQYLPDGSLDAAFGDGGFARLAFTHPEFGIPYDFALGTAAALQPDGALLIGGRCYLPGHWGTCIGRVRSDGTQDTGFGSNGTVSGDIGAEDMALQADGRILLAGKCDDYCVQRLLPDGSPDTGYGVNGRVTVPMGPRWDEIRAVKLQADGKLLATGLCWMQATGSMDFCTVRINTDGSVDTGFGVDGIAHTRATPVEYNSLEWGNAIAVQPDGRIVVAGRGAVIRYNTDGSRDASFGTDGIVPYIFANTVALQANGRIVTGGGGMNTWVLHRLNSDGSPDSTLGVNGELAVPLDIGMRFANEAAIYGLAVQPDGRIVAVGTLGELNTTPKDPWDVEAKRLDFAVVRFFGDPTNRPPSCSGVTADITQIAVASHGMQLVTLSGASDPDGDAITLTVTGVRQDEPVNGLGDGDTGPDAAPGPAANQVYVRAERAGNGDGRVYRIAFTATDASGATCSGTSLGDGTVRVAIPRGQSAVDSGALYDSFAP